MEIEAGYKFRAKWNNILIEWYWSGQVWYCSKPSGKTLITGAGKTKDLAFYDFLQINELKPTVGMKQNASEITKTDTRL